MENTFELRIVPSQISKGGKVKIRFIDRSERKDTKGVESEASQDSVATSKVKLRIGEKTIPFENVSVQSGATLYDCTIDTSKMEYSGYFAEVVMDSSGNQPPTVLATSEFTVMSSLDGINEATTRLADNTESGVALKKTERERTP